MLTKSDAGGRGGLKTSKIGWHNMWTAPNWKGAEYSWGGWGCRKSTTDRFLWSPPPRPRCSSASNISIAKLLFRKDITFAQPWSSDPIDPHRYLLHSWWIFGYQKVSTGNVPKNHQIQTENEKLTRDIDLCIMSHDVSSFIITWAGVLSWGGKLYLSPQFGSPSHPPTPPGAIFFKQTFIKEFNIFLHKTFAMSYFLRPNNIWGVGPPPYLCTASFFFAVWAFQKSWGLPGAAIMDNVHDYVNFSP